MIDLRPVFLVIGLLLTTLAIAMMLPAWVDALYGDPDWKVFAASAAVSLFIGVALVLSNRAGSLEPSVRQVFLLTTVGWLAIAAFAALPFAFSNLELSFTDAFFEAMSGITTTGSTVITDFETVPRGILLWRAVLQWLGGIGTIIMAVAVLPVLKIGGMQMFRIEGLERSERVMPRAAQYTSVITIIYIGLTAALALALWQAGMGGFDAVTHAMTTISTGGFSNSADSIAHFRSAAIEGIVLVGMILGGMPFLLFVLAARGQVRPVLRDSQIHWYLAILLAATIAVWLWLWSNGEFAPLEALRHGAFMVVSMMTGTGFFTTDFSNWTGLPLTVLFFLTLIGGCAGSTSGGVKVFRIQILFANARVQTQRLLGPHAVLIPYYNRKAINDTVAESVMGFLLVYALTFAVLAMGLAMLGLDFMTAASGAASAIANVGPGLGQAIGPAGDYAAVPDAAKWLLAGGMLLGRLEMFLVLVLFAPTFWRP
ncbi:MAG: TrkH family potassium uptake protein [Rhodospirillales bacterium]|nr:TrkH family potassium uptake protein [Rhodospirillales bacterium]